MRVSVVVSVLTDLAELHQMLLEEFVAPTQIRLLQETFYARLPQEAAVISTL